MRPALFFSDIAADCLHSSLPPVLARPAKSLARWLARGWLWHKTGTKPWAVVLLLGCLGRAGPREGQYVAL